MSEKKSPKVKIFVGYFKRNIIFESEIYQPILTSSIDWEDPKLLRDDTGINISEKNKSYAELTGHYWVWKNFLQETDAEYIGFCHYRRFLDFNLTRMPNVPFRPTQLNEFRETFKKYTEDNILKCIEGYDVILPEKFKFEKDIFTQYLEHHPPKDLALALDVIKDVYPEYLLAAMNFIASKEMYPCLHFIMKKELFNEYMEWMFNFLTILEQRADWSKYDKYMNVRMPAFIAERFFNVWLLHNIETKKLKTLNTTSVILTGKDYGAIDYKLYKKSYDAAANSELYRSKI